MSCCIVIPAYEPENSLIPYLDAVLDAGMGRVVLVDDGSGEAYAQIFHDAALRDGCTVLSHVKNQGKGAALKTAISWYLENADKSSIGIITADCDGQHSVADVQKVYAQMKEQRDALVLGCRDFGEGTPQRSAVGNRVTSAAMRLLYGIHLKDTQTGLRGLPNAMLEDLKVLKGERYEYELNMLIYAKQKSIPFALVSIETIYFDNNAGSHYRTIADSARIFGRMSSGLVQYALASGASAMVDIFVYCLMVKLFLTGLPLMQRLLWAAVIARMISSVVNYTCNRRLPYVQNRKLFPTMLKYYCLWLFQLAASITAVWLVCELTGIDELLVKMLVDAVLALVSYQIQMRWVFSSRQSAGVRAVRWNAFGRFARWIVRASMRGWDIQGAPPAQEPAVYVVHHQNMYGPVHTMAMLGAPTHMWVLHVFLDRHACYDQYYQYTFTKRFGWPHVPAMLAAGVLSLLIPPFLRSIGSVPVYRSMREIRQTMQQSLAALQAGESLVICPDVDYANDSPAIEAVYTGFLGLEKLYFQQTQRHLAFLPAYCSKMQRQLVLGAPLRFEHGAQTAKQRRAAACALASAINALGSACGDICPDEEASASGAIQQS